MAKESAENFLAHHGVLGMKWGQHKARTQFHDATTGHTTAKKYPIKASHEHVQSRELKRKPLHELSNQELKKLTERQTLEQRHSQLNPSKLSRGKKALLGVIGAAGIGLTLYNNINSKGGQEQ